MKSKLIEEAKKITGTFQLDTYPTNYAGKVGCALVTGNGNIYTGISVNLACNVGNCAEHAAVCAMLKMRETRIEMIVAFYEGENIIAPCGRCREMIMQIDSRNKNTLVILENESNPFIRVTSLPMESITFDNIQSMEQSNRYLALDVLRGMTIALMILVNTPGSWQYVYAPLRHAEWHGCTPTDLVFPFFLFVVGVSLFFSLAKYQIKLSKESLWRIGRRTLLIFVLGIFINSYPQWLTDYSHLRIMGVLQRIAVAYGIAALIVLVAPRRWLPGIGVFILLIYWGILYFFGGSDPYSLPGNATIPFDRALLGENHLYRGFGIPFDPEGILSSLPSVVTVLIGYLAGMMIRETPSQSCAGKARSLRNCFHRRRIPLGIGFSHKQAFMDQFLRTLYCRSGRPAVGLAHLYH